MSFAAVKSLNRPRNLNVSDTIRKMQAFVRTPYVVFRGVAVNMLVLHVGIVSPILVRRYIVPRG